MQNRDELERAINDINGFASRLDAINDPRFERRKAIQGAVSLLRAELSRQENAPLTWSERIKQMTVEEKATWLCDMDVCRISSISVEECNSYRHCTECMKNMLNSAAEVGK